MDYEKKYKEALEKAKKYDVSGKVDPVFLSDIFPELVESEDESIRKELIDFVCSRLAGFELGNRFVTWIKKQKPVEWSEEDVRKLNIAIYSLLRPSEAYTKSEREQVVCWLKSFFPQPKQEWSKEDIEMIDYLIRCCETEHEELCNDKYGHQDIVSDLKRNCRKKWDWLESLKNKVVPQKQWKPTEEQMKELKKYLCDLEISHNMSVGGVASYGIIKSLYEQLKAL